MPWTARQRRAAAAALAVKEKKTSVSSLKGASKRLYKYVSKDDLKKMVENK